LIVEDRRLRGKALEDLDHLWREPRELSMMRRSEALDQFFALLGESEEDFAPVRGSDHADDSIAKDELVNNADRAVVADLQLLSEVADGELAFGGGSSDGQECLVLVRGEVLRVKQVFAEAKELSDLIPKSG